MITDHTGWHNTLLPIIITIKISQEQKSKSFIRKKGTGVKPQFYSHSLDLVTFASVIYVVTGIFSWEHLEWLAYVTAWLELSDYSQLSNYFFAEWIIAKYSSLCTNHIKEIIIVMITLRKGTGVTTWNGFPEFLSVKVFKTRPSLINPLSPEGNGQFF